MAQTYQALEDQQGNASIARSAVLQAYGFLRASDAGAGANEGRPR
jgi:hypothetical protein